MRESKCANQNAQIKMRKSKCVNQNTRNGEMAKTVENKARLLEYLSSHSPATSREMASLLMLSESQVRRILSTMKEVIVEGNTKNRVYRIV